MTSITRNIYIVKSGLCCEDVKKSLEYILYKNRDLLSKTSQQFIELKKLKSSDALTDNGIKEMLNTKKNDKMDILINQDNIVLTAFNKNSIESGLVLLCNLKNTSNFNGYIYPTLYVSRNRFKNLRDVTDFKKEFGSYNNSEKYWNNQIRSNSDLLEIKKNIPLIDWSFASGNISLSDVNQYNFSRFEQNLIHIIETYHKNIIIIADDKFIVDLLKKVKGSAHKYDRNRDIIEYSCCYGIEITLQNNKIKYNQFNKIYPTSFNYNPLKIMKYNNSTIYQYDYRKEFILNNSQKYIEFSELKKLFLSRCSGKRIMDQIFNISSKNQINKKKSNENKSSNVNNNHLNKKNSFSSLLQGLNKE
jgi:hypothetical protein